MARSTQAFHAFQFGCGLEASFGYLFSQTEVGSEAEGAAPAMLTFHPDISAHHFCQSFADRQSQSGAAIFSGGLQKRGGRGRGDSGTQAHYPAVEDEETGYPASRQVMAKHRHFADAMHSGG
jgi:hypothetical protein